MACLICAPTSSQVREISGICPNQLFVISKWTIYFRFSIQRRQLISEMKVDLKMSNLRKQFFSSVNSSTMINKLEKTYNKVHPTSIEGKGCCFFAAVSFGPYVHSLSLFLPWSTQNSLITSRCLSSYTLRMQMSSVIRYRLSIIDHGSAPKTTW